MYIHALRSIGLPDLNPFDAGMKWLGNQITGLFVWATKALQTLLLQVPALSSHSNFLDYWYGEALGLSGVLIIGITMTVIPIAMFWQKRIHSIGEVLFVALLLGVLSPNYFWLCDQVINAGNSLGKIFMKLPTGSSLFSGDILTVSNVANILGVIVFGAIALFWMGILILISSGYVIVIIAVKFLGLIVLALAPLGKRSKRILEWLISLAIVSLFLGRPVEILFLQLGLLADNVFPGSAIFNYIDTLIVTIIVSIALVFLVHVEVVKHEVVGKVFSVVRGEVTVTQRGSRDIDVRNLNLQHADTMRAPESRSGDGLVKGTAEAAAGAAVAAGVKKIATTVHPAAGAAVMTVDHVVRNRKSKRTASEKG